jgi:hypothetical protein
MSGKRKGRDAAASASSNNDDNKRKRSKLGGDETVPKKLAAVVSVFEALVSFLYSIHEKSYFYFYQVELSPGTKLYSDIGTFSELLDFDESKSFEVLRRADLVGIDKNKKAFFKREKWDAIASLIPGFSYQPNHSRKRVFIFGLGDLGDKFTVDHQAKAKMKAKRPRWVVNSCVLLNDQPAIKSILDELEFDAKAANSNNLNSRTSICYFSSSETEDEAQHTRTKRKNKRRMRLTNVGGTQASLPNGYKAHHKNTIRKWEAAEETVSTLREAASKGRSILDERNQIIIGTLAGRFPQAADVTVEQMVATSGIILASQMKLLDVTSDKNCVDFDDVTNILPSRTTVNTFVIRTAAHKVIAQANQLRKAKRVYIGADKGGGVLIKKAFFTDGQMKVQQLNLDFDKAGDNAKDGALAIAHSLKKYTFEDDPAWKIGGGSSDSGGGFTGAAMKKSLVAIGLADSQKYIHVNCTHHNDQTNLRVSIEIVYGSGGLDQRNVSQLIHAFSDTQNLFDGKIEVVPMMTSAWKFVRGANSEPPPAFLAMMQEPILTRWGTVGEACRYTETYLDVTLAFTKALCGSRRKASAISQCASNFNSLAAMDEILVDLGFLADFDRHFFHEHLEFNHLTDENIGTAGFLPHHHLVRYFIKTQELMTLTEEVTGGTIEGPLPNPRLTKFWSRLADTQDVEARQRSLDKARTFLKRYKISLDKHNEQFASADLLFLAAFGEAATGRLVARLLVGEVALLEDPPDGPPDPISTFVSPVHERTVDLEAFQYFLLEKGARHLDEAVLTENFQLVAATVKLIADGRNIWDGSEEHSEHRAFYLLHFGSLPSTSEMVERAVKKARLCQRTGKGERNVTAYGIAGDGVSEACDEQSVVSRYAEKMTVKRTQQQAKAEAEGREARSKAKYEEDFERGPSLTRNTLDHALKLHKIVGEIRQRIGEEEYKRRFEQTVAMLRSLDNQGSAVRYARGLEEFDNALGKQYEPSSREKETGITVTPLMGGQVPIGKLLKSLNAAAIEEEAVARQLIEHGNPTKVMYSDLRKKIKADVKERWIANNPGKEPPVDLTKNFFPLSDATFQWE